MLPDSKMNMIYSVFPRSFQFSEQRCLFLKTYNKLRRDESMLSESVGNVLQGVQGKKPFENKPYVVSLDTHEVG